MVRFVGRRLLGAVPLLLGVLTLVFLLVDALPGRPFQSLREPGTDPGAAESLARIFGTGRPLAERYVEWLGDLAHGDLGLSLSARRPVAELLLEAVRNTLALAGLSLLLQFALGIGAGGLAARWRGSRLDNAITLGASVLCAAPSYWVGIVLAWLLSVRLGWLPASQMHSLDAPSLSPLAGLVDTARHLILPVLSLTLPAAGEIALYTREQLAATLGAPFVRAARARGLGDTRVTFGHALRASLPPLANLLGLAAPALLGGSAVVEVLFAWPGMGRMAYQAVLARDLPLVLGCTSVAAALVILGSLLADLLTAAVDPRVREHES